jgi:LTXXQ motif family protein
MAAMLLLVVPLLTLEADARGGGGGHGGGGHGGGGHGGGHGGGKHGAGFGKHGGGHGGGKHGAGFGKHGAGQSAAHSVRGGRFAGKGDLGRRAFGDRAIANVALRSQFGAARFHGGFFGSAWPWWRGGLVLGWFGPLFWPYAHYDLFDYVYWPYAYDDFWPYAYDDVYYGIYGPYAYYGSYGASSAGGRVNSGRYGSARYATTTSASARRAAEVCSNQAPELTDWPIERVSQVVQPTDAQRPALDELRAASVKAIDILKSSCPKDLPSIPTERLAAMESRLQVMLAAVQTVRPALERFYQSLSDEQKARFNAIAPTDDPDAAGKDRRDLTKFCDEKARGVTDLPIDRIGQAVQPTPAQRAPLDELNDASVKAAEGLKTNCPTYQTLTPTGRVEAMEKRLDATLAAAKTVQPALAKFYNSLSDEQKARFNSLRSASRPAG